MLQSGITNTTFRGNKPLQETSVSGSSVTVNHTLGYHPTSIQILNSNDEEEGASQFTITKVSDSQFTVDFGESVSGYTIRFK